MKALNTRSKLSFPAVRGIQAQCEYYVSMVQLGAVPRLLIFDDKSVLPANLRAQRQLNTTRIPELTRYITDNPKNYVFSAITVSVGADVEFSPIPSGDDDERLGMLHVTQNAKIIVNDGQHRRQAIENALQTNPELEDETIAVVFFVDPGLNRCQQMFADLNRYAVRPSKSLGVLYDHRSRQATLTRQVVKKTDIFRDLVDPERNSLARRSSKLFTLSSIHTATKALMPVPPDDALSDDEDTIEDLATQASLYWTELAKQFPHWKRVQEGKLTAGEVRDNYLHSHGIALQAFGKIGRVLRQRGGAWKRPLKDLATIDWLRANTKTWEGRALVGGKVSKSGNSVILTTNAIKTALNLPLTEEEQTVETIFKQGHDV